MKTKKILSLLSVVFLPLLVVVMTSCSDSKGSGNYNTGGEGILVINLPGSSGKLSAKASPIWPPTDDVFVNIEYQLILTGNGDTKYLAAKGGDTIRIALKVGSWDVRVDAYYMTAKTDKWIHYATGFSSVYVNPDGDSTGTIILGHVGEACGGCLEWIQTIAPTCTTSGEKIKICLLDTLHNETQVIDPLGHDSGAWHSTASNCTELGTNELRCTRCSHVLGVSSVLALGHSFGNWITTTLPTCTTAGEQERTCSIDNYTETQSINPIGHDHGAWHSTVAGTCTEYGTSELRCNRCAHVLGTAPTSVLGHSWELDSNNPTCLHDNRCRNKNLYTRQLA